MNSGPGGSSAQMKTMATLPECTACIVMMIRVADAGGDDDDDDDDDGDDHDGDDHAWWSWPRR